MLIKYYRKRIYAKVFFILLGVIILLSVAGEFLVYNQTPMKSDAIIVLSGGGGRIEKAINLYFSNYARYLILSNAKEADMAQNVIKRGIPTKDLILENSAQSTYTNAVFTYKIMKKYNLKSAIVVSSNYHMRRVKFNFDGVYKQSGIKLIYCAAQNPSYHPFFWWTSRFGIQMTFSEYAKLIGNAFGWNGPEAKKPLKEINRFIFGLLL